MEAQKMQEGSKNAGKLLYNKRLRIDALQKAIRGGASSAEAGLADATGQNFKIKPQGV